MRLLFAAATSLEIEPFLNFLKTGFERKSKQVFCKNDLEVFVCITGVGMLQTTFSLMEMLGTFTPDFAVQAGVAGVYGQQFALGTIVVTGSELLGDLGAEDREAFLDIFDLGLMPSNEIFSGKALKNPLNNIPFDPQLPVVNGLSVNAAAGNSKTIARRMEKYNCAVETMEGGAFHFVCLKKKIPFLQVRSISNDIEPRDKSKWEMKKAIETLNSWLVDHLMDFKGKA